MTAKVITVDFRKTPSIRLHKSGKLRHRGNARDMRPVDADGRLLTAKQIRARARRKAARAKNGSGNSAIMTELEFEALYKPLEEWDMEELARGRPRDVDGGFKGRKPKWITREVYERAMEQFQSAIRSEMNVGGITAMDTIAYLMNNEERDERGRPIVPPSVKLQASAFLVEHLMGKPKQRVETDISVKLQGILGSVLVNPADALSPADQGGAGYQLGHLPGQTIPLGLPGVSDDDSDDDLDEEAS